MCHSLGSCLNLSSLALQPFMNLIISQKSALWSDLSCDYEMSHNSQLCWPCKVGFAYQGKDIMFRFIIEYNILTNLNPWVNFRSIFIWRFLKDDFWLVLKLEISSKVLISWRILVSFNRFFEGYIFAWWHIWVSIFFKILFNVNGKAIVWHPPCWLKFFN